MTTDRQLYALAHPLGDYGTIRTPADLAPYRRVRDTKRGLLMTILAVDRQARLNDGAPVWHVSVSLWARDQSRMLAAPGPAERAAVRLLEGVGGDREWWVWNPEARVGHLRVNLTSEEVAIIPPGCPVGDAGVTGPERRRTRR